MIHRCTACFQQGIINDFPSSSNMRSHLGAPGSHNMGPHVCQVNNCGLRTHRIDRNSNHAGYQAQWARDQGLCAALNAAVRACRHLRAAAAAAAAAAPAPAAGAGAGQGAQAAGQVAPLAGQGGLPVAGLGAGLPGPPAAPLLVAVVASAALNHPAPAGAAQGPINPPGTGQGQAGPFVNGQGQVGPGRPAAADEEYWGDFDFDEYDRDHQLQHLWNFYED